jgi:hypothetical protein
VREVGDGAARAGPALCHLGPAAVGRFLLFVLFSVFLFPFLISLLFLVQMIFAKYEN